MQIPFDPIIVNLICYFMGKLCIFVSSLSISDCFCLPYLDAMLYDA